MIEGMHSARKRPRTIVWSLPGLICSARLLSVILLTCSVETWCQQPPQTEGPPSVAPGAQPAGPTIPPLKDVNPELLRLVIADQWDRGNDMFGKGQVRDPRTLDGKAIAARDDQRHKAVRRLLAAGQIQTANDYSFTSLIFQHSDRPQDLLLAHVLSVTAVAMGKKEARWMAAATMDRYLQTLGQPQVFGTQFFRMKDQPWTMDPYDRTAISDAERAVWCVVPLARQNEILAEYQKGGGGSTQIENCK